MEEIDKQLDVDSWQREVHLVTPISILPLGKPADTNTPKEHEGKIYKKFWATWEKLLNKSANEDKASALGEFI